MMKNKFFGFFLIAVVVFLGIKAVSAQFALSSGGCGYGYGYDATTGYGYGTVACPTPTSTTGSSGGSLSSKPWTPTTTTTTCSVFTQNLVKGSRDGRRGISEVAKAQSFLNKEMGLTISVDGIFGSQTYSAVSKFQSKYSKDILSPIGRTTPTGKWMTFSKAKANAIECK